MEYDTKSAFSAPNELGAYSFDPYGWPLGYALEKRPATTSFPVQITSPFAFFLDVLIIPVVLFFTGLLLDRLTRKAIRIRLSTAIILMLVASLLVGLNSIPEEGDLGIREYKMYGWPYGGYIEYRDRDLKGKGVSWKNVGMNATVALFILGGTAFIAEWYFRRRDKNAAQKLK